MPTLVAGDEAQKTEAQHCPKCHRLLFRGVLVGEIKCGRCGYIVKFGEAVQ